MSVAVMGFLGHNSRSIAVIRNVALIIFIAWASLVVGYWLGCNRWAVRRWIRRLKG
jgi:hypothetical protein